MHVLFATTLIPNGERSGGELVSRALIETLEQLGHRVIVAGFLRPNDQRIPEGDTIVVARRPIETADAGVHAIGWLARSVLRAMPYISAKFFSGRYRSILSDLCARERIDAVIIDHTQMFWLRDRVPKHIRVALVMHNAESDLYARSALHARSPIARFLYRREARLLRGVEANAALRADRLWVLSEADAGAVRPHAPAVRASVLPVIPELRLGSAGGELSFDVALLATWTWRPNADALRWFLSDVHPRLPRSTTIHIAGPGAEWLRGRHPGITYRGFVEDAAAFLRASRVIAVPTRYGSGLEMKMLAAIATGLPIVATSISTRGLGNLPGSVAVADDAPTFAKSIVERVSGSAAASTYQSEATEWCLTRRHEFLEVLRTEMSVLGLDAVDIPSEEGSPERMERLRGVV
jgi:polysaccharide biosynthesis protein PslH